MGSTNANTEDLYYISMSPLLCLGLSGMVYPVRVPVIYIIIHNALVVAKLKDSVILARKSRAKSDGDPFGHPPKLPCYGNGAYVDTYILET